MAPGRDVVVVDRDAEGAGLAFPFNAPSTDAAWATIKAFVFGPMPIEASIGGQEMGTIDLHQSPRAAF